MFNIDCLHKEEHFECEWLQATSPSSLCLARCIWAVTFSEVEVHQVPRPLGVFSCLCGLTGVTWGSAMFGHVEICIYTELNVFRAMASNL